MTARKPVGYLKSCDCYMGRYYEKKKKAEFRFAVARYGPLAEELAKRSSGRGERIESLIDQQADGSAIMKLWNAPTNTIYSILIDAEDVPRIEKLKWYINTPQNSRTLYVANDSVGKLHRFVVNADEDKMVDHINRNGLDNRKSNLRLVDNSTNKKNMDPRKNNAFGQNGVSYEPPSGKHCGRYKASWQDMNGKLHKKSFSEGKYPDALERAIAYRKQMEKENGYLDSNE